MPPTEHIRTHTIVESQPASGGLTRRQSLQWMGTIAAGLALPLVNGCSSTSITATGPAGHWPDLQLDPITSPGYGTDPNLVAPHTPWPLSMTAAQRELMDVLADMLIPRDGDVPSAAEVGVTDVVDEWISAPYPKFQHDRVEILSALAWLDEESRRRFACIFVEGSQQQQLQIIDDIAFEEANSQLRFVQIAQVFDSIRTLVTVAFFSSPEGSRDLGYLGNTPIAGDYPGPSPEALQHLDQVLQDLGLSSYAYRDIS